MNPTAALSNAKTWAGTHRQTLTSAALITGIALAVFGLTSLSLGIATQKSSYFLFTAGPTGMLVGGLLAGCSVLSQATAKKRKDIVTQIAFGAIASLLAVALAFNGYAHLPLSTRAATALFRGQLATFIPAALGAITLTALICKKRKQPEVQEHDRYNDL